MRQPTHHLSEDPINIRHRLGVIKVDSTAAIRGVTGEFLATCIGGGDRRLGITGQFLIGAHLIEDELRKRDRRRDAIHQVHVIQPRRQRAESDHIAIESVNGAQVALQCTPRLVYRSINIPHAFERQNYSDFQVVDVVLLMNSIAIVAIGV